MPTDNPRLNLTLDPDLAKTLAMISKKRQKPMARVARDLIEQALEDQEDYALSQIANRRLETMSKTIPHDEVWARLLPQKTRTSKAKKK
jgi:predicted DNA-binding protein